MPLNCRGVPKIITSISPTIIKDARLTDTSTSVEWNRTRPVKCAVLIIAPDIIGFNEPNLETIKPDVGPNIKSTKAKGIYFHCADGIFPNPTGLEFLTKIGIVWKIMNIDNPTNIIIKLA